MSRFSFARLVARVSALRLKDAAAPCGGPDFVCFGAQKAGTGWLFGQMRGRAGVWMPPVKEVSFFSRDAGRPRLRALVRTLLDGPHTTPDDAAFLERYSQYRDHETDAEWYRRLFDAKAGRIAGDISPNYEKIDRHHVRWAARALPEAKFVYLVRHPVERAWSALCMDVRSGKIDADAMADWRFVRAKLERRPHVHHLMPSKIWRRWSAEIPGERLRFWFFDDIAREPGRVIDEIAGFVGAAGGLGAVPRDYNAKGGFAKVAMSPDIAGRLDAYFADEVKRCADTFGGLAKSWGPLR